MFKKIIKQIQKMSQGSSERRHSHYRRGSSSERRDRHYYRNSSSSSGRYKRYPTGGSNRYKRKSRSSS